MYDAPPGVIKGKNYSEYIQDIKLMSSQNSTNNSVEKIGYNKTKEINSKLFISKNIEINEYAKKPNSNSNYMKSIEFTDKTNTPKNPFLIQNRKVKNHKNKEGHFYLKNDFNKNNKNKKSIKSYVSPSFDYNFKNNHNINNIKLNIKNNNSIPIKLKKDELTKKIYKSKNNNSNKKLNNSSIDVKASSSSLNVIDSMINKMKKNNFLSRKSSEKNSKKKINFNTNYNPDKKKYLSFTPGANRKKSFIKNRVSASTDFDEKRRKEDIKKIFEREFNRKMFSKRNKKRKNIQNKNNSCLISRISLNKTEENINIRISESQKNIHKNKIATNTFKIINDNNQKKNENNTNKSDLSYDKYRSLLEQKIIKLKNEIENLKNEEKNLSLILINYQEKEKECNDIRNIREEIEKYKIIIEKSTRDCEEYASEIQQIKRILGEENNNINFNIDVPK